MSPYHLRVPTLRAPLPTSHCETPPTPLAWPGTGSHAGVWAVLRGRIHVTRGEALKESALGIAIRAIRPEIRPFFCLGTVAHMCVKKSHTWPKTSPNGLRTTGKGAPNRPRSVTDALRGPPVRLGTIGGRSWPIPFLNCDAEWGGSPEPKTGLPGGHHWLRPTLKFRAWACAGAEVCF